MTLHLGVVARCLNASHVRGMGRYVQELLIRGARDRDTRWTLFGNDPSLPMKAPEAQNIHPDVFAFRGDRFEAWSQLGLPNRARRRGVDVLHCTEGALPLWQPVPTVVTVHDTLAWRERDESFGSRLYWDHVLKVALHRCAAVITISESSRRDIIRRWPDLERKLEVIPHGIGEEYFSPSSKPVPAALRSAIADAPFLVYVGGPMARKRFDWAVRVLDACGLDDLRLVACGFGSDSVAAASRVVPDPLKSRVHFAPFLENEELVSLYRSAVAVLYPTLYEGFGFPAVEAQAAGTPVVFSAVSSLAELVGPLALVAGETNLDAWCGRIREAYAMRLHRSELAAKARDWASGFSWDVSYTRHLEVFSRVAADAGALKP